MSLTVLTDYLGRKVRLTAERRQHILQYPEMVERADKIGDVLAHPEGVFVPDLTLDQISALAFVSLTPQARQSNTCVSECT
jgi:hypothetical protein